MTRVGLSARSARRCWADAQRTSTRIPADVRLLLLILGIMLPMRAVQTSHIRWLLIDGAYYTEVARHVRDGLGLSTHVSLYHAGIESFPAPSSVYPLWPWVLGTAAKVADLVTLAHWLPFALSFVALGFAFAFGRRLWPDPPFPTVLPSFHAGHLFVLVLGLQADFVVYTSLPYTEALSWALLLPFFWRLRVRGGDLSLAWAVEIGVWASLAYFVRSQMIVVPIAVVMALSLRVVVGPDRGRAAVFAAVATLATLGPLAAWLGYLRGFVLDAGLGTLLRFDQHRLSDALEPLDVIVETPGILATAADRAWGLVFAWDPLSELSYRSGFHTAHWALPLALPFLAGAAFVFVRREGASGVLDRLRHPAAFGWLVILLVALGGWASIQLAHKQFNGEWYFHRRQSLIAALAFALPMAWMLRSGRSAPVVLATLLLSSTVVLGGYNLLVEATTEEGELRSRDRHREIVSFLERESKKAGLTVVMQGGALQRVAWRTTRVGYHSFERQTSYADLLTMTDRLGAKYLIFQEDHTGSWRFRKEGAGVLDRDFEELPDELNGYTVLARRKDTPTPLPTQKVVIVGVDGATWKVMGPMIARGELPTFQRLRAEGASLTEFDTLSVTHSPVVWTTVATGRQPEDHGVTDYTQEVPGIGKVPITSNARKVPALWNVASEADKRVAVINWWASWPSEEVNGIVVSDHANPAAAGWMEGKYLQADEEVLRAMAADTWPGELAGALAPHWIDPAAFPLDEFAERTQLSEAQLAEIVAAPYNERSTYSWFKTFFAVDRPHFAIALDVLRDPPDLAMLYLRGPDPVQHYAWDTVEPAKYPARPKHLDRDRGVVQGVYRMVDSFLAEIVASIGPETTLIVLSDHGAEPEPHPERTRRVGGHTRNAKGVVFLWGPHVQQGVTLDRAGPLDIAPTVAWALGLPVARDLPGRVMSEGFTSDFRARRGIARTSSWGAREAAEAEASPADENMLEQLRGLGYVE